MKIAFIICVNNELYFKECCYYINRLIVPNGYEVDIIAIRKAVSMCAGYNAGMRNSDAKYKVYLHQDVMIRDAHFLEYIVEIFAENKKIGMIGMMGGTKMPKTGVTYRAWNVGMVDCRDPDLAYYMVGSKDMKPEDTFVEAVDGLLIATQYDIPWREDLFTHFDFYDVSQSFEMRKAGYDILVPYQKIPWVIHDSGFAKLNYYDEARQIALEEYPEYLYANGGFDFVYDKEWNELSELLAKEVKKLIEAGEWEQVGEIISSYRAAGRKSSELEILTNLYNIHEKEKQLERKNSFFSGCLDYEHIYNKYNSIRFLLRRMEMGMEDNCYQKLVQMMYTEDISASVLLEFVMHCIVEKEKVVKKLITIYDQAGHIENRDNLKKIEMLLKNKQILVTEAYKNKSIS